MHNDYCYKVLLAIIIIIHGSIIPVYLYDSPNTFSFYGCL